MPAGGQGVGKRCLDNAELVVPRARRTQKSKLRKTWYLSEWHLELRVA
jgi:hypothetical protein